MNKLARYSGILLLLTGILHILVGLVESFDTWKKIICEGLIDTIGNDLERGLAFWFLMCGVLFMLLGYTIHYYIKKEEQPAPILLGYFLLFVSILVCLAIPLSGGWLIIPQAIIIICANRKRKTEK